MIIKHKISVENNEEVLVVYLDPNLEEFADELGGNSEEREKNLKQQILDYLKERNIKFSGNVVKVLAGAFLVATLSLGIGMQASAATNQTYVVQPGDSLYRIANTYGMSIDELKQFNNLYTDTIYPGQTLTIGKAVDTTSGHVHVVSTNDSLYNIARSHNLSVSQVKEYNQLTSDTIHPGQKLLLIPNAEIGSYTVKSGDSLWSIAKNYGMTVDDLKSINNTENIQPGQTLNIIQARTPDTYTVQLGDSLWTIANRNNTTIAALQEANNLNTDAIYPGQTLVIPTGVQATTTTQTNDVASDITVSVRRTNGTIQSISLEEYVTGVVGAELGAGFNEASYKAQAVAARTYGAKRAQEGKILTDTDSHQVYRDPSQLRRLWGETDYSTYFPQIQKAVRETQGEVIMYEGDYIDALFFSTSNGRTEEPNFVWGGNLPYLKSVESPWDVKSPYYYRVSTYTYSEFAARLGISQSNLYANVLSRTSNGSVNSINISGRTFSGNFVKSRLGLRSTDFDISFSGGRVSISQRGWGHSVGLSQYGAYYMGEEGYSYSQIIHHYYQGVTIVRI